MKKPCLKKQNFFSYFLQMEHYLYFSILFHVRYMCYISNVGYIKCRQNFGFLTFGCLDDEQHKYVLPLDALMMRSINMSYPWMT
jgi:hypothetical protein